jgi:hypothetical protein
LLPHLIRASRKSYRFADIGYVRFWFCDLGR